MINRVKINITGKNPDYILNELIKRNINIYHLEKNYKSIIIIVDYNDYLEILDIKTTYKIKVLNKYGICKIKEVFKNNIYFFIFITLGIFLNIILSNLIFEVKVMNPNKKIVALVEKDLKEEGISKYKFKVNYKRKEEIISRLLEKEKDKLEWIEIDSIGTKYIVNVEERKINKEKELCKERNIISKKEAIILEINSSNGEIIKKKNDYVSKGEVIISGFIHNKDDIVSKRCADGTIYGEVWYKVIVSIPKVYEKHELTNKLSYGISLNLFNRKIDIHKKMNSYKKINSSILNSYFIPFNLNFTKYIETKSIRKIYDINNVDNKAISISTSKIKNKLKENEMILSKKVLKKTIKNSKIDVEVFIKVKENITDYQDISNINIDELNKKEE